MLTISNLTIGSMIYTDGTIDRETWTFAGRLHSEAGYNIEWTSVGPTLGTFPSSGCAKAQKIPKSCTS